MELARGADPRQREKKICNNKTILSCLQFGTGHDLSLPIRVMGTNNREIKMIEMVGI